MEKRRTLCQLLNVAVAAMLLMPVTASSMTLTTGSPAAEYLLIGTGSSVQIGTTTAVSNFELGANTSVVPMPGLAGSVPPLPANAATVAVGITNDGDIAITDTEGNFNLSNVDLWGNMGVDCAAVNVGPCINGISNSNFNGTPMTPSNGVNANVNLNPVLDELSDAALAIDGLAGDILLDFSLDGIWDTDLTINLLSGVTVIDFDTGGNDLSLTFESLLIDGPSDAFAIFRIPDDANFNVSQSNLVVGNSGIGLNNVLFFSDKQDNNVHINIDDAIVNGVAFWDLGKANGEIQFDNVQGCTQVVADKINLNDVRLMNCGFASVPEPDRAPILALGLAALAAFLWWQRRGDAMRLACLGLGLIWLVGASPGLALGPTFSVDFQGPSIGAPDSFAGIPIDEGSILTTAPPGPTGPNPALLGPLPPPGVEVGALPGAPGAVAGGLGILPGPLGFLELDALTYGRDRCCKLFFSVDEFAAGVPSPLAPNVFTEGSVGALEASADVFTYLGLVGAPAGPGPPIGNTAFIDGDGIAPSGLPGLGLIEPNPPTPVAPFDPGDNLDAVDIDTVLGDLSGPIYFSLDSFLIDVLEGAPVNSGTATGIGFSGADVLVSAPGGVPGLAIPAGLLGLDLLGFDTDDLDALAWDDDDGDGALDPGEDIFFSVRRGSAVIGAPDSNFGVPIEEGDILTIPGLLGPTPGIAIAAEVLGLGTVRSGTPNPFGFGDDLDALDLVASVPEPGTLLLLGSGVVGLAFYGRRRMVSPRPLGDGARI